MDKNLQNLQIALERNLNPDIRNPSDYQAPSKDDVLTCDFCGEVISGGEPYLSYNDTVICDNCLEDMNAKLLLEILKIDMEV